MSGFACSTPRARPGLSALKPAPMSRPKSLCCTPARRLRVARKVVEHLRVEQQRAAAQLVLDEELRQRLDLAELLHRLAEVQPQALRAPARHQPEVAQFAQIVTEGDLVGAEPRERLAQLRPLAAVDRAGSVGRFDRRGEHAERPRRAVHVPPPPAARPLRGNSPPRRRATGRARAAARRASSHWPAHRAGSPAGWP